MQEKQSRSIVKSLSYRLMIVVLDVTVIYLLTSRLDAALGFALISNIYTTIAYYFHERIWNRISWGKKTKEQKHTQTMEIAERKSIIGEAVFLRPFGKDDLRYVERWLNDAELRKLIGEAAPMSRTEVEKWYEELLVDQDRVWFAIVLKKDNRVIGEAGLLRMFKPFRSTDMTIIIGEKDEWGKGYGTEVGHLLLQYAFRELALHRISIGVVGFNERALKFWKNLGFKNEGVERDDYYFDNKYSDCIMMSILENEWKDRKH